MGTKPDLEIFGSIAKEMGIATSSLPMRRRCSNTSTQMCVGIMFHYLY